jgi:hypothetical protein
MKTSDAEKLHELTFSKNKGNAVGIRIRGIKKTIVTAVEDIITDEAGKKVILKSSCIYGDRIPQKELKVEDIEGVIRFRIMFEDPFYVHLRRIKDNIRNMKTRIDKLNMFDYSFRL